MEELADVMFERFQLHLADAKTRMVELQGERDKESAHEKADDILCSILKMVGCGELVDEFMKIDKWYV